MPTPKNPNSNRSKKLLKSKSSSSEELFKERFSKRALSVGFTKEQADFLLDLLS